MLQQFAQEDAIREVARDLDSVMLEFLNKDAVEDGGFRPGGPFSGDLPPEFDPMLPVALSDEQSTIHVIPWEWKGEDIIGGLANLGASLKPITMRGVTIVVQLAVDDEYQGFRLFRYVDWMDAFNQAGISVATRPIRALADHSLVDATVLDKECGKAEQHYNKLYKKVAKKKVVKKRGPIGPKDEWVQREVPTSVERAAKKAAREWFTTKRVPMKAATKKAAAKKAPAKKARAKKAAPSKRGTKKR